MVYSWIIWSINFLVTFTTLLFLIYKNEDLKVIIGWANCSAQLFLITILLYLHNI